MPETITMILKKDRNEKLGIGVKTHILYTTGNHQLMFPYKDEGEMRIKQGLQFLHVL